MEDKKVCEKCGVLVSKFAYNRHLKSCTGDPKKFQGGEISPKKKIVFTGTCKFCGKECKNSNSQRNHELRCKLNSNRILMDGENNPQFGKQPWNKGFSKENNESLKKASLKIISNYKYGKVKHPWLGRKHPAFRFYGNNESYICEVRYGDAAANALQRGLWTNTKNALSYFDSATNGWINYSDNLVLVKLFSHALVSTYKGHEEAIAFLVKDIESQKTYSTLR